MKVRVKLSGTAKVIDIGDGGLCTFDQLRERTAAVLQLGQVPFSLSLNKHDLICGGDDQTVSALGIVPGDLIFVLCSEASVHGENNSASNHSTNGNPSNNSNYNSLQGTTASASSSSSSSCASCNNNSDTQNAVMHTDDNTTNHVNMSSTSVSDAACEEQGNQVLPVSSKEPNDDGSTVMETGAAANNQRENRIDNPVLERDSASPCPLEDPVVNRCLQEPLLCRESTLTSIPVLLRDMFNSAGCLTVSDALWVAVHTLMMEVGFRPMQGSNLVLTQDWNRHGFYKQEYRHISVSAEHSCALIGVPMDSTLVIHGVTSGNPPLKTDVLQLKVTDYVQSPAVDQDVCNIYKQLGRLSRILKDSICQQLLSQVADVCGFAFSLGLLSLSYELRLKVLSYLPASSLTRMGQLCKTYNTTFKDPYLWRRLYLREFGQNGDNSLNKDWYQMYKDAYQMRKERRKLSRHRQHMLTGIPPWLNPPPGHFPPLAPPPYPSGIIGGDYDMNPEFATNIRHPLFGGPRGSNPFRPQAPGALFLPRPRFDDPFGPRASHGTTFMTLGINSSRSSRASPFSSLGGNRF